MQKRFEQELEFRFDKLADDGAVTITNSELYRWYGRERITKGVWEDIEARWEKRDEDSVLFVGKNDESANYTIIWGQGLTADEDAYFQPIAVLAGTV